MAIITWLKVPNESCWRFHLNSQANEEKTFTLTNNFCPLKIILSTSLKIFINLNFMVFLDSWNGFLFCQMILLNILEYMLGSHKYIEIEIFKILSNSWIYSHLIFWFLDTNPSVVMLQICTIKQKFCSLLRQWTRQTPLQSDFTLIRQWLVWY